MAERFQSSPSVSGAPPSAAGSRRAITLFPRAMANCSPRSTAASKVAAFFWNSSTVAVLLLVNLVWFQGQINYFLPFRLPNSRRTCRLLLLTLLTSVSPVPRFLLPLRNKYFNVAAFQANHGLKRCGDTGPQRAMGCFKEFRSDAKPRLARQS